MTLGIRRYSYNNNLLQWLIVKLVFFVFFTFIILLPDDFNKKTEGVEYHNSNVSDKKKKGNIIPFTVLFDITMKLSRKVHLIFDKKQIYLLRLGEYVWKKNELFFLCFLKNSKYCRFRNIRMLCNSIQ